MPTLLTPAALSDALATLHPDWRVEGRAITRRFKRPGFAEPTRLAMLAAELSERVDHHADIAFGWGYCTVTFTTHDTGGVTELDVAGARALDAATAPLPGGGSGHMSAP